MTPDMWYQAYCKQPGNVITHVHEICKQVGRCRPDIQQPGQIDQADQPPKTESKRDQAPEKSLVFGKPVLFTCSEYDSKKGQKDHGGQVPGVVLQVLHKMAWKEKRHMQNDQQRQKYSVNRIFQQLPQYHSALVFGIH